jgi:roadblock/LC7 domain-containing protein
VAVAVRAWAMKGSSSGAEWSPDGQSIAYQGKMGEKSGLMSRGRTARTKF